MRRPSAVNRSKTRRMRFRMRPVRQEEGQEGQVRHVLGHIQVRLIFVVLISLYAIGPILIAPKGHILKNNPTIRGLFMDLKRTNM